MVVGGVVSRVDGVERVSVGGVAVDVFYQRIAGRWEDL